MSEKHELQTTPDDDIKTVRICFALLCEDPSTNPEDKIYYEKCSDAFERLIKEIP